MSKCPKCSRRVESFAVDTNCSFRMCSNVSCTWPFDSDNMGQYFEYDAAVPSIRKRAKKRKANKDETRKLKKAKTASKLSVEATDSSIVGVSAAKAKVLPSVAENAAQISSWLSDLCDSNIKNRATPFDSSQRSSIVDNLDFPVAGNYQNNMGSESLGDLGSLSNCNKPNIDIDDSWIKSLLGSSSSSSDVSILKHNGLNSADSLSDHAVAMSDAVDDSSCLLNNNVADIFAVLGHGITPAVPSRDGSIGSGDAGVPRNSRQNSPAASNSESGNDDVENPILSADDLAMIIGGASKPHNTTSQQASATTATAANNTAPLDTSALFDPISMLLSPPNSATAQSDGTLDLFSQYYWPPQRQQQQQQQQQQQPDKLSLLASTSSSATLSVSAVAATKSLVDSNHLPFDLNKLFNVPAADSGNSNSASDMVASLGSSSTDIENIFGKSTL
ncbi:hypothetical protein J3B02_000869 [Coemansia erecta]|uniref:Uncharacterized protein n=1 Tax=Coemansia asiatica TaxID=1052880 RepID=A0A9W8CKX6_9FUNG|nr:hypothetical protein LPJ64_002562 [Coemansia asiatica]KAJ2857621.1 hypothetical protein J3B02_000869 [Coemansia erecta]KAJ2879854.1 hypothetical protein FB639_002980 [Coemansia asiatica]